MYQSIKSGVLSFLRKENIVAPKDYNRWRITPASIAIHLCIGSVYAWSVFHPPLTREFGVVASSAGDWSQEHLSLLLYSGHYPILINPVFCG